MMLNVNCPEMVGHFFLLTEVQSNNKYCVPTTQQFRVCIIVSFISYSQLPTF